MKIGLGLVTCNREDFYNKVVNSIIDHVSDEVICVAVSDGKSYSEDSVNKFPGKFIQHETNKGVGASKNDAMNYLLENDCDYIFLIEDDIIIKDGKVFEKYIELSKLSGIQHLNFGYHGPANKPNGQPTPKLVINYGDITKLALNHHCVGAFSFYTKELLNEVGVMDTTFVNAWEHVEHTYSIIKAGYHTPYWWFADLANSYDYLDELACSEDNSTIRGREDWQKNIQDGYSHFVQKHGTSPIHIPQVTKELVLSELKRIKNG